MSKQKLVIALILVLCCIFAFCSSFAYEAKPKLAVTIAYDDMSEPGERCQVDYSGDGFALLWDLWQPLGEEGYFVEEEEEPVWYPVGMAVTLLEDYEADEEIDIPEYVDSFDGGGHTITLTADDEDSAMYFSVYKPLEISNLTINTDCEEPTDALLRIDSTYHPWNELIDEEVPEAEIDDITFSSVNLTNVTLDGLTEQSIWIEGAFADFTFSDCTFVAGENQKFYFMYEPYLTWDEMEALELEDIVPVSAYCTIALSDGITYEGEDTYKLFLYPYEEMEENMSGDFIEQYTEEVNELYDVDLALGMLAFPIDGIYFVNGFCDIEAYDLIIHFNNYEFFNGMSMYLNEWGYNYMILMMGREMFSSRASGRMHRYFSRDGYEPEVIHSGLDDEYEGEGGREEVDPREWDVQVELLKDITLYPDDFKEYFLSDTEGPRERYEETMNEMMYQPYVYSIKGNGYTYTMNINAYPAPILIYGYGDVTYENVVFDQSANDESDYGFIFMAPSGDLQTTVTLDNVSIKGGNRAAVLVQGSNLIINGGEFTANEDGIGGIEYTPYYYNFVEEFEDLEEDQSDEGIILEEGEIEDYGTVIEYPGPVFGTLSISNDVTSENDHRLFVHADVLDYFGSGDAEEGLAVVQEYIEGATLAIDEEDGNAYEVEVLCNVTFNANGGSGNMSGDTVKQGEEYKLPACKFTAPSGKTFDKWEVAGKSYTAGSKITVTEDVEVKATWKTKSTGSGGGGGGTPTQFKVTITAENAEVTPATANIKKGKSQTFTFKAKDGNTIIDVLIDGKSVGAVESYTFENVKENHKIEVVTSEALPWNGIDDWALAEMKQALSKGLIPDILKGKNFSNQVSRGDFTAISVSLYEALTGKQAVKPAVNPFKDTSDEFVLKAFELGITKGVAEDEFGDGPVDREQMSTMMDRTLIAAGVLTVAPPTSIQKFADDAQISEWAHNSVYSMAEKDIIKGVGEMKFEPKGKAKIEEAIAISVRCENVYGAK